MNSRISWIAPVLGMALPAVVMAQDYDFQDTTMAIHYVDPGPLHGPGVFPSSQAWTGFLFPGAYTNNGVTLNLSAFPEFAVPEYIVDSPDPYLHTPAFVLSQSITDDQPVSFALSNIPAAHAGDTYDLALYSTDFDGTGGSSFALTTGSGYPDKGINSTVNSPASGTPNDAFIEGVNYVVFDDVIPAGGAVALSATPLFGQVDLNAVQLVTVPLATTPPMPGDCNSDGCVNLTDLLTLLNNYGQSGMDWSQGDFNGDGTVNLTDLLTLLNNYGLSGGGTATSAGGTVAVPEPAAIPLVLAGTFALFCRRSRRRLA